MGVRCGRIYHSVPPLSVPEREVMRMLNEPYAPILVFSILYDVLFPGLPWCIPYAVLLLSVLILSWGW